MTAIMGGVTIAEKIVDSVPERDMLKTLVARVERIREGKDSLLAKTAPELPSNMRIWGKPEHQREFSLNQSGSATHIVRNGETLRAIVADVLRQRYIQRNAAYEPAYQDLSQALATVKGANSHIADFDMLAMGDEIEIPAALVPPIH